MNRLESYRPFTSRIHMYNFMKAMTFAWFISIARILWHHA